VQDQIQGRKDAAAAKASGAGGVGGPIDPDKVAFLKKYYQLNNSFPKYSSAKDPNIAEAEKQLGKDPNAAGDAASSAAGKVAKSQALTANDKMLTKLRPAFQALDGSYKAMMKVVDAAKVPDNQPAAEFKNWLQTKMGSGTYSNLNRWIYDTQNEMAQLAAAGQNVVAVQRLKNAQDLINKAQTAGQIKEGYKQMQEAAQIIVGAREDESKKLRGEISDLGKSGGAAPAGGGTYKGPGGKGSYAMSDVERAATAAHMSVEAFAKLKGLTLGN
jgi:hypothetical protein